MSYFHARIKRVVCSGGGAKGIGYPGCYKAMEKSGLLKGVDAFSGASAGAITAAFMAVGMPSATLRLQLHASNLSGMLGNRVGSTFSRNKPGITTITKDGKPIEEFIRHHLVETVRAVLASLVVAENIEQVDLELLKILRKFKRPHPRFTFGDLAVLNRLYPDKFKQLVIPATQFPGGELFIFNSELTPNVEIALACRASSSIPIILQPVEIKIGGRWLKFVDGGVYDNLPTDYFDKDAIGQFTKNKMPEQTMVFAFGEGLDNKRNSVFQALYGHRWDEVLNDTLLEEIIDVAIRRYKKNIVKGKTLRTPSHNAELLCQAVQAVLTGQERNNKMTSAESSVVMTAAKQIIYSLFLDKKNNGAFWKAYRQEIHQQGRVKLLGKVIKEKMKPILSHSSRFEKWKRNVLIETLGDLHLPYKNSEKKEHGYHKIRTEYALRTVEVRVGYLDTRDFNKASKLAREMDALGYLDTMNYITNHDLHDLNECNAGLLYVDLVKHFESIYHAVLAGAGIDPNKDPLIARISSFRTQLEQLGKTEEVISRQLLQVIKGRVERRLDSIAAFALSRAVELNNHALTADDLFKETYEEGFKRSGYLSISNITGKLIYSSKTLHEALKDKNMLALLSHRASHRGETRTEKVYAELKRLGIFSSGSIAVGKKTAQSLHDDPASFVSSRYHLFAANTNPYQHINRSPITLHTINAI